MEHLDNEHTLEYLLFDIYKRNNFQYTCNLKGLIKF